jgi:hypothetical protein
MAVQADLLGSLIWGLTGASRKTGQMTARKRARGTTSDRLGCARRRFGRVTAQLSVTSPSFCTTANERVYITTSSGIGANGGSQGAVGDRRAAICGANAAGAGGL